MLFKPHGANRRGTQNDGPARTDTATVNILGYAVGSPRTTRARPDRPDPPSTIPSYQLTFCKGRRQAAHKLVIFRPETGMEKPNNTARYRTLTQIWTPLCGIGYGKMVCRDRLGKGGPVVQPALARPEVPSPRLHTDR